MSRMVAEVLCTFQDLFVVIGTEESRGRLCLSVWFLRGRDM